jgi:hypothetical protein
MPSIQDRLKKLPPYDDDIPMIKEVKEIAKNQSQPAQIKEEESEVPQEISEETEEVKEEVKEGVVEPEVKTEEVEKPKEEVSERTAEQIEKLTQHSKELKEENTKLYEDVLTSLRPKEAPPVAQPVPEFTPQVQQQVDKASEGLPQDKVDDIIAGLIDENGYVDPELLKKTLRESREQAQQAITKADEAVKEAKQATQEIKKTKRDFEESTEVRKVHKLYPQIDPKSDQFNELFWDDVRKELATAPILKGTTPTFMEAATQIWEARYKGQYASKEVEQVNKQEKEKMTEVEDKKKQINASIPAGRKTDYYAQSDQEALRQASIQGKKGALAERLRRAGQ